MNHDARTDFTAPQLRELPPLLALAESNDVGNDTDDSSTPGKYNERSDNLWGAPLGSTLTRAMTRIRA